MEMINKLERFVVNNDELALLETRLNEFNPFEVLKVDKYEIRHSNVLAWLLNPKGNHGLGSLFIKRFLSEVFLKNDTKDKRLTVFDISNHEFNDVTVKREWKDIDILVICEGIKTVVLIENKVYAKEKKGQLKAYLKTVKEHFSGYELIPIYLTLFEDEPSEDAYYELDYGTVQNNVEIILNLYASNLNPNVFEFINYYSKTLKQLTMKDEELIKLSKEIYNSHKEALDYIYKHAATDEFQNASKEFVLSNQDYFSGSNCLARALWLMPKSIGDIQGINKVGLDNWFDGYPVVVRFSGHDDHLRLIIQVGPFINESLRERFMEYLRSKGLQKKFNLSSKAQKSTRIYSDRIDFNEWDDKEKLVETLKANYSHDKLRSRLNLLTIHMKEFNWDIE